MRLSTSPPPAFCAPETEKPALGAGFGEAADGTRTHDLLHGKQYVGPDIERECGLLGQPDGIGLHPITGDSGHELVMRSSRASSDGAPARATRSLHGAKQLRAPRRRRCPYVVPSEPEPDAV
jgi:hypothetical protein